MHVGRSARFEFFAHAEFCRPMVRRSFAFSARLSPRAPIHTHGCFAQANSLADVACARGFMLTPEGAQRACQSSSLPVSVLNSPAAILNRSVPAMSLTSHPRHTRAHRTSLIDRVGAKPMKYLDPWQAAYAGSFRLVLLASCVSIV
jgi:hypothetical protein